MDLALDGRACIRMAPMISITSYRHFFLGGVFSRAAPTAYGGPQARGLIGAVAAGLR